MITRIKTLIGQFLNQFKSGQDREGKYYFLSISKLSFRWWKNRTPKLDILLLWPKIIAIKGRLTKEP